MTKKVIYIAGPYRDTRGAYYILQNILKARKYALAVWTLGGIALCPHANTFLLDGANDLTDAVWLNGDIELMKRCDAVWAIPDYNISTGARTEVLIALARKIPVFTKLSEVKRFLRGDTHEHPRPEEVHSDSEAKDP